MTTFTLNGVSSDAYNITVSNVQRELLPGRTAGEITIPGRPGSYDFGEPDVGKRKITLTCHFEPLAGLTLLESAQRIALWLYQGTALVVGDQPGMVWTGRVLTSAGLDNMTILGKFQIAFEAQPYAEDAEAITAPIGEAVDYGSLLDFAPVFTIALTAAMSTLTLQLVSTGEFVRYDAIFNGTALAAGDVLLFDMGRGYVSRNGLSAMTGVSPASRFFLVPPGLQTITVTPSTGLAVQMSYKRRYP